MKKGIFAACLVLAMGFVPGANAGSNHSFGDSQVDCSDSEDGGTVSWSPDTLWPPNHKLVPATFVYNDDQVTPNGTITFTLIQDLHSDAIDEDTEETGSGDPSNTPATDSTGGTALEGAGDETTDGTVSQIVQVRSERSGRTDGRTYRWELTASADYDGDGIEDDGCETEVTSDGAPEHADDLTIFVPHDCRNGACKP